MLRKMLHGILNIVFYLQSIFIPENKIREWYIYQTCAKIGKIEHSDFTGEDLKEYFI